VAHPLLLDVSHPGKLIAGHEREFWEYWIKAETYNPYAISEEALSEWISCLTAPGGLPGCLESYRAGFENARINQDLKQEKLTLPIVTVGATEFFGAFVSDQMRRVSESVERSEVFDQCGHSIALEAEDRPATTLREFMLGR